MKEHVAHAAGDPSCPQLYPEGHPPEGSASLSELLSCGDDAVLGDMLLLIRVIRSLAESCVSLRTRLIFPEDLAFTADSVRICPDGRRVCTHPLSEAADSGWETADSGWETADGEDLLAALTELLREIMERFPHAHAADIIEALPGSAPDSGALLRLFSLMEYELRQ